MLVKLKDLIDTARRERDLDTLLFYTTFLGDIEQATKGKKEVSDDIFIATGKIWRKGIENNILLAKEKGYERLLKQMNTELCLLEDILPEQLSEDLLSNHILTFIEREESPRFGDAMKFLKQNFNGLYDGRIAARIAKELLDG